MSDRGVILSDSDSMVITHQDPIPWCTTHNAQQSGENYCWKFVDYAAFSNVREANCELSTGGPDHKWWEDV